MILRGEPLLMTLLTSLLLTGCYADVAIDGKSAGSDDAGSTASPYEGGWPVGACRDDLSATGNAVGQVANDFALPDQFGDTVHLHDFCDRVVWLVFAAFW
jgi:cytochrome oxidase Cu insertion factor (SCO1/SenC/PrrC family)